MADGTTEFCCRNGGSNLNAGTLVGDSTEPGTSPSYIYESGNWDSSTGEFIVASGNPSSDGVAVTQYASVYASDSGVTNFVGQVSAVSTTGITIDLADHYMGTIPTTGSGDRSLRVGGAWAGPSGLESFPLDVITSFIASGTDSNIRVNMKNDKVYTSTSGIELVLGSNKIIQGYTTNYRDRGEAKIEGPATGPSFILLSIGNTNSSDNWIVDMHLNQNGDSAGSSYGVLAGAGNTRNGFIRCRVSNMYQDGILANDDFIMFYDCEFYNNGRYGVHNAVGNGVEFRYCRFHNNSSHGLYSTFSQQRAARVTNCIFALNGADGINHDTDNSLICTESIFYRNSSDGINVKPLWGMVTDCAFFANSGYGIRYTSNGTLGGGGYSPFPQWNNAFGSGTMANTLGNYNTVTSKSFSDDIRDDIVEVLDFNPWNDPDNGDFTLKSGSSLARAGFTFTQRNTSFDGTISNRSIGATDPGTGETANGESSYSFFS